MLYCPVKRKWQNLGLTLALMQALSLSPLQAQESPIDTSRATPRMANLLKVLNEQLTPFALDPQNQSTLQALEPASAEDLKGALSILKPDLLSQSQSLEAIKAKLVPNSQISKLYFAALLEKYATNLRASSGYLKQIAVLYDACLLQENQDKRPVSPLERTTLLERQGDLAFLAGNSQEAINIYNQALAQARQGALTVKLKALLAKEIASLEALGELDEALNKAQSLMQESMVSDSESNFHKLADSLWAHLEVSDLLRKLKKAMTA